MFIIFLGAPGAGKGTHAAEVAARLGLAYVATGDMFRDSLKKGTPLGLKAKEYMDRGQLVPDEVTVAMLTERLAQPDCRGGVVLDGFPRTITQAEALDAALARTPAAVDQVIHIAVPDDELVRRLSGRWICRQCQTPYHEVNAPPRKAGTCDRCGGSLYQRDDDKPATVKERLKVYHQQTAPLVSYYERAGKLVDISGVGAVDAVRGEILAAIDKGVAAHR